jgi:hypothetical protein
MFKLLLHDVSEQLHIFHSERMNSLHKRDFTGVSWGIHGQFGVLLAIVDRNDENGAVNAGSKEKG